MEAKDVLLNKQNFAVIGVSNNPDKYGYKIYHRLKEINKKVYGVSPLYQDVEGDLIYPDLTSIPDNIDVAVFVVNPKVGLTYLNECVKLNITHIWLQPGTYDDTLIEFMNNNNLTYYQNCILVESNKL